MRADVDGDSRPEQLQRLPRVIVAVPTFRRPAELARALGPVISQASALGTADATVLVIDNDPDGGAAALVAGSDARYVHEARPGIAAARNRALSEAGGADALVFIDDDEQPAAGWLAALVGCWRDTAADAVTGPVEAVFGTHPGPWVLASGRFARRHAVTGTRMRSAASNNLLLDLAALSRRGLRFDEAFGLTGGEDTAFTHDLVRAGGRIVWCEDALVLDHVPADRATRRWILTREFRSGTSYSLMRLTRTSGRAGRCAVRLDLVGRGSVRVVAAVVRLALGVATRDVTRRARGAAVAAGNAGLIAGAFGRQYREYRRR